MQALEPAQGGCVAPRISWGAIAQAAARVEFPSSASCFVWSQPEAPAAVEARTRTIDVLRCLQDIAQGVDRNVIVLCHGVSDEWLEQVDRAVRLWHRRHGDIKAISRLPPWAKLAMPFPSGWRMLAQPKYQPLLRAWVTEADSAHAQLLTYAWTDCLYGDRICLDDAVSVRPLLTWLRDAGVEACQVVVWSDGQAAEESIDDMETIFGDRPVTITVKRRAGRASAYLGVVEKGAAPTPSSASTQGLNALLFAVWVWLQLRTRMGVA